MQAQTEQNKDGTVLVDPVAEAARLEAEQQAAEEARLAAEAAAAAATTQNAGDQGGTNAIGASSEPGANLNDAVTSDLPDWLLGQFDIKAKSPAGFWRCKVQFLHSSPTRVFVVEDKAAVPHDHDCAIPCCYLTPEEAQRVHQDSWLTVVPGSEVTKD
ncbi:hypothetical protein QUC30_16700 [Aeromonas caviae]|uniref:hypothetical protein n=1 Tax=Aeromonas caviae TaxID=648 RepID=UPI003D2F350C